MTINQAISKADRERANSLSNEAKADQLIHINGQIASEVLRRVEKLKFPDDAEKEMAVPFPYDDIFVYYLCAYIDFRSNDIDGYNNWMAQYNSKLEDFVKSEARKRVSTYKLKNLI
jgi:hypothetical protein